LRMEEKEQEKDLGQFDKLTIKIASDEVI